MPRFIHFEIHAEYPEKVIDFYARTFGWEVTKWEGPQEYRDDGKRESVTCEA